MKRASTIVCSAFAFSVGLSHAASITLGSAVPDVGDGVQNLNFSTSDTTNVDHPFVPNDYIGAQYRAEVNANLNEIGQSFVTPDSGGMGYLLSAISVRQVSWGPTDWDYDGGSVTMRLFEVTGDDGAVYQTSELANETVPIGGSSAPTIGGTPGGDAQWLTFTLDSGIPLADTSKYAFLFSATGGQANEEFFMNLDGTNTDNYPGAESVTGDGTNLLFNAKSNGNVSDRAFVASMSVIPEPSTALLGSLGLLSFFRRRR